MDILNSEAKNISREAKKIVRAKLRQQALTKLSIHGNTCNTCARTNVPRCEMEVCHVGPKLSDTMERDTLRLLQEHDNSGNLARKRSFSSCSLFRKMLVRTVADDILQKHKDERIHTVIACNNCNKDYESVNPQEFAKRQDPTATFFPVTGQTTLNLFEADFTNKMYTAANVEWLDEFEDFLTTVKHGQGNSVISHKNRRQVMRQMRIMASGDGLTYHHWKDGVVFKKGRPITMNSNAVEIGREAREFENVHGKDRSNGWLMRHALTKLACFQSWKLCRNN